MAINKKLIHFKKKETFDSELSKGNILDTSIVFIQDAKMIYTHKTYYACPYTKEELDAKFKELTDADTEILAKLTPVTTTSDGLMTSSDKIKLDKAVTSDEITNIKIVSALPDSPSASTLYLVITE